MSGVIWEDGQYMRVVWPEWLNKGQEFLWCLEQGTLSWWPRDPLCLRAGGQHLWWRGWAAPWHSLLGLPMENWPSWRGVRGSTVFLDSLLEVCAVVHEWGDTDMDWGYLQLLCVHCPAAMAVQEKETLDSWPCAVLQVCNQARVPGLLLRYIMYWWNNERDHLSPGIK